MPYVSAVHGRVYIVRWRESIAVVEMQTILKDIARKRQEIGAPLIYVGAIASAVRAPEGEVRRALARFADEAKPYVDSVHLVLEGEGFQAAINRSVVTAIILLTRQVAFVHRSLSQAFDWIDGYRGINRATLLEAAREHGLFE